ncbi:MAG: hypothetical protein RLZZ383_152 [Pseudomonadota bacterium]
MKGGPSRRPLPEGGDDVEPGDWHLQGQARGASLPMRPRRRDVLVAHGPAKRVGWALARAERRERDRLARMLHDDVQQVLAAARLHASFGVSDAAMLDLLDLALDATRGLAHALQPMGEDESFDEALTRICRVFLERHRVRVTCVSDGAPALAPELADATLGFVRELLFNASRHAPDAAVRVVLQTGVTWARLVVADEGPGFEEERQARSGGRVTGRRRLTALGAVVDGWSDPSGTVDVVLLPLGLR